MLLSELSKGRDNNLHLLRICAALAVLASHSWDVATGNGTLEPLRALTGMSLGSLSVDVFFVASGFLVTASLLTRSNAIDFFWARCLRIYPALMVVILLTVLVLGPAFTSLPLRDYLTAYGTRSYLLTNSLMVTDARYFLPGVFENNPYRGAINGSLWTLPLELRMYAMLLGGWLLLWMTGDWRPRLMRLLIPGLAVFYAALMLKDLTDGVPSPPDLRLKLMFFVGASCQVFKDRIQVRSAGALLAAGLLIGCCAIAPLHFPTACLIAMPYLLLYLAFVPGGMVRRYNKLGDYSYGVYIYAFPVQQAVVATHPGLSPLGLLLISCLITLALSVLSWHLSEQRALSLKTLLSQHTWRLLRLDSQ